MGKLLFLMCDRCNFKSQPFVTDNQALTGEPPPETKGWVSRFPPFPVPSGHASRNECWEGDINKGEEAPRPDLCPECVTEYRNWWMNPAKAG